MMQIHQNGNSDIVDHLISILKRSFTFFTYYYFLLSTEENISQTCVGLFILRMVF